MAEEKAELRDINYRHVFPWTELFRGFQIALDPKKLLLAAAGILVMALGWWILAIVFISSRTEPTWASGKYDNAKKFRQDREQWDLLYEAAGRDPAFTDADDLADSREQYDKIKAELDRLTPEQKNEILAGRPQSIVIDKNTDHSKTFEIHAKPYGRLRTWPWFEDRGPNPYLTVESWFGQEQTHQQLLAAARAAPGSGTFLDRARSRTIPYLIEPLDKFLRPIVYLLHGRIGFWNWLYFSLVLVWTLATWALFGAAITRMAAVQIARKEKIGLTEAIRFTLTRYLSFFSAPLFPLIFVLVITLFCILYGFVHMIPIFGDIVVDGVFWPLVLLAGLVMAVILVGLVGWPMMYATISAEGSDSFDALSRSYSYVYQSPWHYAWYALVALAYGAVVVFFVGFMGSMMAYLGKWGVSQTPFVDAAGRDPSFLFVYAPPSFGWQTLLLEGATTAQGQPLVRDGMLDVAAYDNYVASLTWYNRTGAFMVAIWLYLIFLLILGFGYSYFWSASTIIYLLMRRKVDDTELDEVYLEEDESEEVYSPSAPAATTAPTPAPQHSSLTMVDSPALRTASPAGPPPSPTATMESPPPVKTDGNPPPPTGNS